MISKNIKTQERNEIKYSRHTENAGSFPLRDFGTIGDGSFPLRDFGTIGDGSISPVIQEGCSKAKKNYAVC